MGKASLLMVLGFLVIFGSIRYRLGRWEVRSAELLSAEYRRTMARNIANSAVYIALRNLREDFSWRPDPNPSDPLSLMGGTYTIKVEGQAEDSSLGLTTLRVTSTGTYWDISRNVVVLLQKTSFSRYAYFTQYERMRGGRIIWFVTGDTISGPLHTNDRIHIVGSPVFLGPVSSPYSPYIRYGDPQFLGGTYFGAQSITLPTDLAPLRYHASRGGWVVNTDSTGMDFWLNFQADGTIKYAFFNPRGRSRTPPSWNTFTPPASFNGIISVVGSRDLHVQGVVNGRFTVSSEHNIYIEDDIVYAVDPREDPTSDDLLGLVAGENVIVADHPANWDNCEIHASIMALDESFTVEHYDYGSPRGVLTVLGGIIQVRRGPVGTFYWGGKIRSGYRKNYIYDGRLLVQSPPYFPVYDENQIVSWLERK
ncbi:MAG TPA: DUF4900 domain-containing protein [Candidatus Latescibacteria bacterium]|nr:DUF4900 domain-containing protein [Candidatus Latescibacterota bacterium]